MAENKVAKLYRDRRAAITNRDRGIASAELLPVCNDWSAVSDLVK